jgi:SAM-dependent methyltransferase
VRKAYGDIAEQTKGAGCCSQKTDASDFARAIGYSEDELRTIPQEANLALSCGNPTAYAGLKAGEVVLDLGSGAGFDCFLAAAKVGSTGRVVGVDMTPQMIEKARELAKKHAFTNVEFRLGEIEHLPVADNSIDVAISNCVINLSPDKPAVFRELHRVLKKGGRVAISDIALLKELPEAIRQSVEAYVGCVSGAIAIPEYTRMLEEAGFNNVKVSFRKSSSSICCDTEDPLGKALRKHFRENAALDDYVASVYAEAVK